jgi:hypothetical protein
MAVCAMRALPISALRRTTTPRRPPVADRETCPSCDGTIARASQRGEELGTWERCTACVEREAELFSDVPFIGRPVVVRRDR